MQSSGQLSRRWTAVLCLLTTLSVFFIPAGKYNSYWFFTGFLDCARQPLPFSPANNALLDSFGEGARLQKVPSVRLLQTESRLRRQSPVSYTHLTLPTKA